MVGNLRLKEKAKCYIHPLNLGIGHSPFQPKDQQNLTIIGLAAFLEKESKKEVVGEHFSCTRQGLSMNQSTQNL